MNMFNVHVPKSKGHGVVFVLCVFVWDAYVWMFGCSMSRDLLSSKVSSSIFKFLEKIIITKKLKARKLQNEMVPVQ